jgi:4-diphosphocytidyl-2-C-methyl-D-erythritol kinase
MSLERFAPAKVNLFLHVGPVATDGYHPVCSLMVFADVGDRVRLEPADLPGFRLEGAFADTLGGEGGGDNLVVTARDRLVAVLERPPAPFCLVLDKQLPIAAGLGGGSADAAAALRLIADHLSAIGEPSPDDAVLAQLARGLGADVSACLASVPILGEGRGDDLRPAPPMPVLNAVLVNPRAPSPTGAVYRAYDVAEGAKAADRPELPDRFADLDQVVLFLAGTRNDLQAPARALQPLIGEVLQALASEPEALWTRMSGSGATCLAICGNSQDAAGLAARLAARHPGWWVKACRLGNGG